MGCPSPDGRAKVEALKMDSPKELVPEVCSRMARFQREVCAELTSQGSSLTCIVFPLVITRPGTEFIAGPVCVHRCPRHTVHCRRAQWEGWSREGEELEGCLKLPPCEAGRQATRPSEEETGSS